MDENNSDGLSTPSPTVEATEFEKEQHAIDLLADSMIEQEEIRIRIELPAVMGLLREYGLTVDEHGFVIDETTESRVEPAVYDAEAFACAPQPNDYDLTAYFSKSLNSADKKVHLSDVYTVVDVEGQARPVTDDVINIEQMHRDTGLVFTITTAWSSDVNVGKLKEDIKTVSIDTEIEPIPELSCLKCGFQSKICEWDGETNNPVCPDCKGKWNIEMLHECDGCSNRYSDSELTSDGAVFASPLCPSCGENNSTQTGFTSKTRYD